jgi:hypothetical protein
MTRELNHRSLADTGRVGHLRIRVAAAIALAVLAGPGLALAGSDEPVSAMALLESIAGHSYALSGLLEQTNTQMGHLQDDLGELGALDTQMATLVDQTSALRASTDELRTRLTGVRTTIDRQGATLVTVADQVGVLGGRMGGLRASVAGQLAATNGMATNFGTISSRLAAVAGDFDGLIAQMGVSLPRVRVFADNALRSAYPGGDPTKYGEPNLAPGTPVMSIMLPMITQLQRGGALIGKKVTHTADVTLVDNLLSTSVPDGTNVLSTILPYDGTFGLPPSSWFLHRRVAGF